MRAVGGLHIKVTANGHTEDTCIVVTEKGTDFLLGIEFCKQFQLITIADACIQRSVNVDAVHITEESEVDYDALQEKWKEHLPLGKKTGDPLEDLKQIFPDMFDGTVGLFEGEVDLKLTDDYKPVQLPPRAVPLSIQPKLKVLLDKMEDDDIIRECPETTPDVHNLVYVLKQNGELRCCLDSKNLNKYLVRKVHYTASWEDAQTTFKNGKFFSTLDAKSGFWTKKLSPRSQLLTAFNTPFKKYCFKRLPFGLSVSTEIFQEDMDKSFQGIPGTFPCADDIKTQGSTEIRHDINCLETVAAAQRAGLKFNPDKCSIKKKEINYFSRVISEEAIKPDPSKVQAIIDMAPPQNKQELQSFLGSVNFLSNFVPNLSQSTHIMRGLLKKDVHYV